MPDVATQELVRQWRIGDCEAGAQVIRNRMRSGELNMRYVALAAYLGDPTALKAGIEPWRPPSGNSSWSKVRRVLRHGGLDKRLLVTMAADMAEHVLPIFDKEHPEDKRPRRAIEAARRWVLDGTLAASDAASDAFASYWAKSNLSNVDAAWGAFAASSASGAFGDKVAYQTQLVVDYLLGWKTLPSVNIHKHE